MEGTIYTTKELVLKRALESKGIPFKKIDKKGNLIKGKGAIAKVIEEDWFGYKSNSEAAPDFPEAGVELKVTPYIRNKNGIRAKERLSCNIINYMEEHCKTFITSSFWHKCQCLLLMVFEHLENVSKGDLSIEAAVLFSFPEEDLIIIKRDWEIIINKIKAGKAHELSEGDTLYLAACTKGASSKSLRKQPFSSLLAMQRAYALKIPYMTQVLRQYIFGTKEDARIIKHWEQLKEESFEEYIIRKVSPYYGKTQNELKKTLNVTTDAKSLNEILLARMLGVSGKISETEEFQKAGIIPKTIRVQANGTIKEHMSFPRFDFIALSKEASWEDSEFYEYLSSQKFLFAIFKEDVKRGFVFSRIMFWNMPYEDLGQVKEVWERTVKTLREGVILIPSPHKVDNNLPKSVEHPIAHVRPHARNGADHAPLPDGRTMTKQSFWLNNTYIRKQIGNI